MTKPLAALLLAAALIPSPIQGQRTIHGSVVSEDGAPVANAVISLTGIGLTARSDADGTFELRAPDVPLGSLEARAVCYRTASLDEVPDTARVVLQADPSVCADELFIRGSVLSARDGSPVPASTESGPGRRHLDVEADGDGRFAMRVPSPGNYRFSLTSACFESSPVEVNVLDASVDAGVILLEPADSVRTVGGMFDCPAAGPGAVEPPGPKSGRTLKDGLPLPAVQVEVWGRAVLLHVTGSDGEGRFTLPELEGRRIERYVFRHIGLGTEIIQYEDFVDGMDVSLREEPAYTLEGIEVAVDQDRCPQVATPEGRALWESAAGRYNRSTTRRGIGGFFEGEMRDVSRRSVFRDIEKGVEGDVMWNGWPAGVGLHGRGVMPLDDLVRRRGYAWERELDGPEYFIGRDRNMNWVYAELDTRHASHFATPTFGALHTFALANTTDSGTRVNFCPRNRDRDRPWIQGSVLVGPDGALVDVEWRFVTPDPDEEAGGWVRFGTARDPAGGLPHLVAEQSIFYRHNGFESLYPDLPQWVFRDRREWTGWTVSPSGRKPASGG